MRTNMRKRRKSPVNKTSTWTIVAVTVLTAATLAIVASLTGSPDARAAESNDWPMWGGTSTRNMISPMTGLPETWDVDSGEHVKWVSGLGSQTYGNPVVAGGMVYMWAPTTRGCTTRRSPGDKGVLLAFRESNGEFVWQMVSDKLAAGRVNDWPFQGVCSSPLVDGDRLYYVTNRGELLALDTAGFTRWRERRFRRRDLHIAA